jgi:hypothetical protein
MNEYIKYDLFNLIMLSTINGPLPEGEPIKGGWPATPWAKGGPAGPRCVGAARGPWGAGRRTYLPLLLSHLAKPSPLVSPSPIYSGQVEGGKYTIK